ncbi:hypothetical protein [Anaerovibrio slackiae]|uniref:flagellin N-terminal helical domain-containing protein n=1 Tax=Anaerovibrio slackiae TaxID=2652309 RepID=UPI00386C062C
MMKVAEGAVSSTVEILKTLKEKAVNAANDSNTDSDRQTIQKELDQSIDQINDNANVTINGKYLVDGYKNTIGNATYTALSNQSLKVGTDADTKLTDLCAHSGNSLEINETDKITVSYVKGGKTYSTTYQVKDTKLQDIFNAAEATNKEAVLKENGAGYVYRDEDRLFAAADNKSVLEAQINDGIKKAFQDLADSNPAADKTAFKALLTNLNNTATALKTAKAGLTSDVEVVVSDTGTPVAADMVTYGTKKSEAALAQKAYDKMHGPKVLDGASVGLAASDDVVETASGEKAITITANNSGIGGQISGFNISITDSEGNVKKSANAGLDNKRIILESPSLDYLERYLDVDIALDTYPYTGGGTTFDALYMGVPVVSLYGERRSSRFGLSILTNAGVGELAVPTPKEYVERAVALASDWDLLDVLHKNLRTMLENSPAMDAEGYVREIEGKYKEILSAVHNHDVFD